MTRDDFMENTRDVWEIPAESATRVGHPAPFPIELPARLIESYTYRGDLVLDPFAGSGSAAVAAVRAGRHYVGYDLDASHIQLAEARVEDERQRLTGQSSLTARQVSLPAMLAPAAPKEDSQAGAVREGRSTEDIARSVIEAAGFTDIQKGRPAASAQLTPLVLLTAEAPARGSAGPWRSRRSPARSSRFAPSSRYWASAVSTISASSARSNRGGDRRPGKCRAR